MPLFAFSLDLLDLVPRDTSLVAAGLDAGTLIRRFDESSFHDFAVEPLNSNRLPGLQRDDSVPTSMLACIEGKWRRCQDRFYPKLSELRRVLGSRHFVGD